MGHLFKKMEEFLAFKKTDAELESEKSGKPVLMTSVPSPWLQYEVPDLGVPPLVRFHNEILSFCEYIAPTSTELRIREEVLSEIKSIIKKVWPSCCIHVFGSQLTQIITPSSDIDIAVLDVPDENDKTQVTNLYELADAIRSANIASYLEVISSAKVPIIKMDHLSSGIAIDVCINNSSGLDTGKLIKKFVRQYPPLRPLTMVLKVFLSQRRLNETYSGGIGSFVLCCTIVSFLQMKRRLEIFQKVPCTWNLGLLLIEYFALYGGTFNYMHTGISLRNDGSYFRKRENGHDWGSQARPNMLSIENPLEPDVDMGRNSFMMPKIRRSMEHALQLLTSAVSDPRIVSYLSFVIRPDAAELASRPLPTLSAAGLRQQLLQESDSDTESVVPAGKDSEEEDLKHRKKDKKSKNRGHSTSQSVSSSVDRKSGKKRSLETETFVIKDSNRSETGSRSNYNSKGTGSNSQDWRRAPDQQVHYAISAREVDFDRRSHDQGRGAGGAGVRYQERSFGNNTRGGGGGSYGRYDYGDNRSSNNYDNNKRGRYY